MVTQEHNQVANLMTRATSEILWPLYKDRICERSPDASLTTRISRGKGTYHKKLSFTHHQITYGLRMIADMMGTKSAACSWASSREIQRFDFFKGEVTPLTLLAQSVCHEFAHLIQVVEGRRWKGSQHNSYFYSVLDDIYEDGVAFLVRDFIMAECEKQNIDILTFVPEELVSDVPEVERVVFRVGDRVHFQTKTGEKIEGHVRRVNAKSVSVTPLNSKRGDDYWRVTPSFLSKSV